MRKGKKGRDRWGGTDGGWWELEFSDNGEVIRIWRGEGGGTERGGWWYREGRGEVQRGESGGTERGGWWYREGRGEGGWYREGRGEGGWYREGRGEKKINDNERERDLCNANL